MTGFSPVLAMLPEPGRTAAILAVIGVLVAVAVVLGKGMQRIGVPVVLLFLVLGMLGGSEGLGGLEFDDYDLAVALGTTALVMILFDGGLNTPVASLRRVAAPAGLLATLGVLLTAGLVAVFLRMVGIAWPQAMLVGAVVSSTDAAAVFAVLRGGGLNLKTNVGATLEVESCANDPMALILTVAVMEYIMSGQPPGWGLLLEVPLQMGVGAAVGLAVGGLGLLVLRHVKLAAHGYYPALTVALALASFGLATKLYGSGLLAVYATAVLVGNVELPFRAALTRIHDSIAWISQIGVFLMLGLLVYPSRLMEVASIGLGMAFFLNLVARPLAVWLCLLPCNYTHRERLYVGVVGLRGAVPVILASYPALAGFSGGDSTFDLVFFVVVVTSVFPGALLGPFTRWMDMNTTERPVPHAVLEINADRLLEGKLASYYIDESLLVCDQALRDIDFPSECGVVLVVRGNQLLAARGDTVLKAGDHAYLFFREPDRPLIDLLFGQSEAM